MTLYPYQGRGINDIYARMVRDVMEEGAKVTQRGLTTRELSPVVFQLEDPRQRLVTAYGRPVNVAFALAEVLWILTGRSDVEMLAAYNSRIHQFSDDGEVFNAPYGHRLRHAFGHDQLEGCIATLQADPGSRQAVLGIWHPELDRGSKSTKDRACNLASHMMIRDGRLDWTQMMRSNDAIWGLPYNVMQWTHVQEYVAARLGVPMGTYTHLSDSFHIYDPPLDGSTLPDVHRFDLYEALRSSHEMFRSDVDTEMFTAAKVETAVRQRIAPDASGVGEYFDPPPGTEPTGSSYRAWRPIVELFVAHQSYLVGLDEEAYHILFACADPVYGTAQIRFYWHMRWHLGGWPSIRDWIVADFEPELVAWIFGKRSWIER